MTKGSTKFQNINILPDELIIHIFKHLPLDSLLSCENVCNRWKKLSRDADLWRRIVIVYSGKPDQHEYSEKKMQIISSHNENIFCLKLQYVYNYPKITSILEKCNNIISLELVMCRIGPDFEQEVTRWPNLRKLNLKNSLLLLSNADLTIKYDQFRYLNYLSLSDFGLNSTNCNSLLRCAHLKHIYIEKIKNLKLEYIEQLIVSKQEILVTLHFYGGDAVTDKTVRLISKCPLLRDLAIIRCEHLTDEGLVALADLKRLNHLQIWNNKNFTEKCLLKTLAHPNIIPLQSLSFSRIENITPSVVDVISEYYKHLKFLALYQCPMIINRDYEKQLNSKFRNINVVLY